MGHWIKYASWEETQKDIRRARSVYERTLEVDPHFTTTYIKYADMEIRNRFPIHALNILNRAVTILPRIPQFWFKFVHVQEMLGDFAGARGVFERWMEWEPDEPAWMAYVKFELRLNEVELARKIYQRFVACHTSVRAWIKYTSFEEKFGGVAAAREAYVKAIDSFSDTSEVADASLYSVFAKFEKVHGEIKRARAVLAHGIDHVTKSQAQILYDELASLEREHGEKDDIEGAIVKKKRFEYEEVLR
jgi:crooked neck